MHKTLTSGSVLALTVLLFGLAGCAGAGEPASTATEIPATETPAASETPEPEDEPFPDPEPAETTIGSPFTATAKVSQEAYTQAEITVTEVVQLSAEEQSTWPELADGTAWLVRLSATNLGDDTTVESDAISSFTSLATAGDQPQQSVPSGYSGSTSPEGCALIAAGTTWAKGDTVEGCMVHQMPAGTVPAVLVYFSPSGTDDAGDSTYATVTMPVS